MSRGLNWLQALAGGQALAGYPASVKVVDGTLGERAARYIAVVPDAEADEVELEDVEADETVEDAEELDDEADAIGEEIEVEGDRDEET